MASVALIPHQQYSPNGFVNAIKSERGTFKPGAVLEIITDAQHPKSENQQQKVMFIFQNWCVQHIANERNLVGISGNRLVGQSVIQWKISNLDKCWFSEEPVHPGEMRARTITYSYDNVVSFLLPDMAIAITRLIWQYIHE